jgi:hypothetical protein
MSKFVLRDTGETSSVVSEPIEASKLMLTASRALTPVEAKALAKYLNSWAGFEEAGSSSGTHIHFDGNIRDLETKFSAVNKDKFNRI